MNIIHLRKLTKNYVVSNAKIKFALGIDVKASRTLVEVDAKYLRLCEIEHLLGDSTKAKTFLGWCPTKISFPELVKIMVEHNMRFVKKLFLKAQDYELIEILLIDIKKLTLQ